jgi:hypothetical protein
MKKFYTSIMIRTLSESSNFPRDLRITGGPAPHVDVVAAYSPASGLGGKTSANGAEVG